MIQSNSWSVNYELCWVRQCSRKISCGSARSELSQEISQKKRVESEGAEIMNLIQYFAIEVLSRVVIAVLLRIELNHEISWSAI